MDACKKIIGTLTDDCKEIAKQIILTEIENYEKKIVYKDKDCRKHPKSYSNSYYLDMIFYVLSDVVSWKTLNLLKACKSDKPNHFKTVENKYSEWCKQGHFRNAFNNYKPIIKSNVLLIDATPINNKNGVEDISLHVENKKKKVTKLSVLTNENKFIHSVVPFKIASETDIYKTSVHDVKMIEKSLENVQNLSPEKNKVFVMLGDKAYKTQIKYKFNDEDLKIIVPDKKNSITKISDEDAKLLKKRTKVEHTIQSVKCYNRTYVRRDRKLINFMGFIYIACLINNIRQNKPKKTIKQAIPIKPTIPINPITRINTIMPIKQQ